MDSKSFRQLRDIVYEKSGIALGEGKEALVSARMGKRMRILGIASYPEYIRFLEKDSSGQEYIHMIDAISTNVTQFFREEKHFQYLSKVSAEWLREGKRFFRFWSAASSTGEEPYSMAMVLDDVFHGTDVDWKILATDISTKVLGHCREGVYSGDKVKSIPPIFRERCFTKEKKEGAICYSIRDDLKRRIVFSRMNLSRTPYPMKGPFDVVFCRNVMIYFDGPTRQRLARKFYDFLEPGGFLFIGHSEVIDRQAAPFSYVMPSVYRRM